MGNDFLFIHFIILCFVEEFSGEKVFQNVARTHAVDVRYSTGQLYVGTLQHLLESVQFSGAFTHEAFPVADQFP